MRVEGGRLKWFLYKLRLDIKKFTHLLRDIHIIIKKIFPTIVLEERTYVVLIIYKERTIAIGCLQCMPVLPLPVAV